MPKASDVFDFERAIIREKPLVPTLIANQLLSLDEAVHRFGLSDNSPLLLMTIGSRTIAINLVHLVFHHVAQGQHNGQDWMASFCMICNGGACFSPVVEGKVLHFTERGIYNAMSILADEETGSIWNHLTGECMYGQLQGQKLQQLDILQHATIAQAKLAYMDGLYAPSQLSGEDEETAQSWNEWRGSATPELPERWINTIGHEDNRLPRVEMGLGVWTDNTARFYPYKTLNAHNNALVDTLDGRSILVYVDPASSTPHALFIDTINVFWRDDVLQLDNGLSIRDGLVYYKDKRTAIERPPQLFQRWYSFPILFPNGDIY